MNTVVFDLEATCEKDTRDFENEIIEIGAIKLDENYNIIDVFAKFAKPYDGVILTDFCKELTSITQEQIDNAEPLKDVLVEFYNWSKDSNLFSWGDYDRKQVIHDVIWQDLYDTIDVEEFSSRHTNLKTIFNKKRNLTKGVGVKKALNMIKEKFDGTPHRGIDDANNIVKIYKYCFQQ